MFNDKRSSDSSDSIPNPFDENDPYYIEMRKKFYSNKPDYALVTRNMATFRNQPSMRYFKKFDKISEA